MSGSNKGRRGSMDSWGDRPRPKGLGTKHLHFDVANSGYVRESMKAEQDTRIRFYDSKYRLERPPNVVFGETKADCENQYLVTVPQTHECFTKDPHTGSPCRDVAGGETGATLRDRNADLVQAVLLEAKTKSGATQKLADRIAREHLQAKRDVVFKQLRDADLTISHNVFEREQRVVDVDPLPPQPILKNRGTKSFLQAFPNERSKPKFTMKTPSEKPGFA